MESKAPLKTEVDYVTYRVYVDDIKNYPIEEMNEYKPEWMGFVGYSNDPQRKHSLLIQAFEEGKSFDVHVWVENFRVEYDNGTLFWAKNRPRK